jgi:hypothetical protein
MAPTFRAESASEVVVAIMSALARQVQEQVLPNLENIDSFEFSNIRLSKDTCELKARYEHHGMIRLEVKAPFEMAGPNDLRAWEHAGSISLGSGETIHGRCYLVDQGGSVSERGSFRTIEYEIDGWRTELKGDPVAWLFELQGITEMPRQNLSIFETNSSSTWLRSMLALQGKQAWYLLSAAKKVWAVFAAKEFMPENDAVFRELQALEFVQGKEMVVGAAVGIAKEGSAVGSRCVGYGIGRSGKRSYALVPRRSAERWMPEFFKDLVVALEQDFGHELRVAMNTALTAQEDSIDSQYLKLHVALEALCASRQPKVRKYLVRDRNKWNEWIEKNRIEIEQHALDTDCAEKLLGKVASAFAVPSGSAVEWFFESKAMRVSAEFLAEIPRRNGVAHTLRMSTRKRARDVEEEVKRIDRLRLLLFAAIAQVCGYQGPLTTEKTHLKEKELSWWTIHAEKENVVRSVILKRDLSPSKSDPQVE